MKLPLLLFQTAVLLLVAALPTQAQRLVPDTTAIYGGSKPYNRVIRSIPTRDGGFLVLGATRSNNGDFTPRVPDLNANNNGFTSPENAFAARFDSIGRLQWAKIFGGTDQDYFTNAAELSNGDFAITGLTRSNDYDLAGRRIGGYVDGWLLRLDASGTLLWSRCYGSNQDDYASAVVEAPGGGLLLLCTSYGHDSDALYHYGSPFYGDWLLIRTDGAGNRLWRRMVAGTGDEQGGITGAGADLYPAPGGGYYLIGYSDSHDSDLRADNPSPDGAKLKGATFLRLDSAGVRLWCKRYGSVEDGGMTSSLMDLRDTTVVAVGTTSGNDHHFTGNHMEPGTVIPQNEMFLVKVDRNGNLISSKLYGTVQDDGANGIAIVPDGSYLLLGFQLVDSPFQSGNNGSTNAALYLIDKAGLDVCSRVYGSTYRSRGYEEAWGAVCRGKRWYVNGVTSSSYFTAGKSSYRDSGGIFVTRLDYWPLGIAEEPTPTSGVLVLTPNPTHDGGVRASWPRPCSGALEALGGDGRTVWRQAVTNAGELILPTTSWPPGTYTVVLRPQSGVPLTARLVVQ